VRVVFRCGLSGLSCLILVGMTAEDDAVLLQALSLGKPNAFITEQICRTCAGGGWKWVLLRSSVRVAGWSNGPTALRERRPCPDCIGWGSELAIGRSLL